jgi:hypothetical protein
MQNDTVKVVNCTAQPIHSQNLEQVLHSTAQAFNATMNQFSDEVPTQETEKEKEAKGFLNNLRSYMNSAEFTKDINATAVKYKVPPKQLAQNFFTKALGTVGDILGITISAVCNAGHMIINLGGTILHGIIDLIRGLANAFASIVTFNQTCHA